MNTGLSALEAPLPYRQRRLPACHHLTFLSHHAGLIPDYVTSDLWAPASGIANFQCYLWDGTLISNISIPSTNFMLSL